jgi:hypothetical protein
MISRKLPNRDAVAAPDDYFARSARRLRPVKM